MIKDKNDITDKFKKKKTIPEEPLYMIIIDHILKEQSIGWHYGGKLRSFVVPYDPTFELTCLLGRKLQLPVKLRSGKIHYTDSYHIKKL